MSLIIGLWKLLAWLLITLDADQIPGKHRGTGRGKFWYWSTRQGTASATMVVQWLIAERQSPIPLSLVDFTNEWRWKVYEEWNMTRMSAGGW